MLHEHPIKILRYTAKNLWLLIFPLLRSAHFFPFSAKEVAAGCMVLGLTCSSAC